MGGDAVTMYETEANQLGYVDHLTAKGVPFGVLSMSDKWQLHRERLVPDRMKYPDLRGFADRLHQRGLKVLAWFGLWLVDSPPTDWCALGPGGDKLTADPESPDYAEQLVAGVKRLIGPDGYDIDGFFIDFTSEGPYRDGVTRPSGGKRWGIELLRHYVKLIHDAAKSVKPHAMMMTHCSHPLFADITDVLRLNDYCFKQPDVTEQARYRQSIAAATSDWLINTDNWFMYSTAEWRRFMEVQPELGIPATWYVHGVHGDGTHQYEAFSDDDYNRWAKLWNDYRHREGLA